MNINIWNIIEQGENETIEFKTIWKDEFLKHIEILNLTTRTIERQIAQLRKMNKITRIKGHKEGYCQIIDKNND